LGSLTVLVLIDLLVVVPDFLALCILKLPVCNLMTFNENLKFKLPVLQTVFLKAKGLHLKYGKFESLMNSL